MAFIKNLTDTGLSDIKESVVTMQSSQQAHNQDIMSEIGQQIENVSSSIKMMHDQMTSNMEEVERIAETVQAEMQDTDKKILAELSQQEARAGTLAAAQEQMLSQVSYNASWQEKQEDADFRQELPARLHEASASIMLNLSQGLVQVARIISQELSP